MSIIYLSKSVLIDPEIFRNIKTLYQVYMYVTIYVIE